MQDRVCKQNSSCSQDSDCADGENDFSSCFMLDGTSGICRPSCNSITECNDLGLLQENFWECQTDFNSKKHCHMSLCLSGQFKSGNSCLDIKECLETEYETQAPTTVRNRICQALTECNQNQYESQAPHKTQNRKCSICPAGYYCEAGALLSDFEIKTVIHLVK